MARKARDKDAKELNAAIEAANRVPDDVKILAMRRGKLERCLIWRNFISGKTKPAINTDRQFLVDRLREEQIGLLKLRVWRTTGQYPSQN